MADVAKYEKNKIIVGDFVFKLEGNSFVNGWKWAWNKAEISEEYNNLAMRLMNLHNEFYGQFINREIEEYVTAKALVYCDKGGKERQYDELISHGVTASNGQAVLTCKDCDFGENLLGWFGKCEVDHSTYKIPGLEDQRVWINDTHSCFPILEKEWRQKEGDLAIAEDETGENFVDALRSSAYLTCMYGGEIRVKNIPDKPEEEEKEDKCECIDGWLKLYKEKTIPEAGRYVPKHKKAKNYDWAMPEDVSEHHTEEWFQNESWASKDIKEKGGSFVVNKTSNNLYIDGEGRYWVAVGPSVVNDDYIHGSKDKDVDASQVFYGTKMDVLVEEQDTEERYYIRIVNGDTKEHSAPEGLYQTGVPFNESRSTDLESAGNTVEFMGYHIIQIPDGKGGERSSVNITNNYRLIGIYVYDGEFNYE